MPYVPEPKRRSCACMQSFYRLCDLDPQFRIRQAKLEDATRKRMAAGRRAGDRGVRVIPVVVHVVYKDKGDKIAKAQVASQIKVLNADFNGKNGDISKVPPAWKGLVGQANLRFELAKEDPNGGSHEGITYTETDREYFSSDDDVKRKSTGGVGPWDTAYYLNIWVCRLGDGLLGYAQFPGGPKATDGVVITTTAFGTRGTARSPFNRGRTATHEVGHFLNLRHIWGDTIVCGGTDFVADTPDAKGPNYGTPAFPSVTCANGPHGDMFMNYMDYVDDAAMYMFTIGQVERMDAALAGPRARLGYLQV